MAQELKQGASRTAVHVVLQYFKVLQGLTVEHKRASMLNRIVDQETPLSQQCLVNKQLLEIEHEAADG